jgi:hypothetical protein
MVGRLVPEFGKNKKVLVHDLWNEPDGIGKISSRSEATYWTGPRVEELLGHRALEEALRQKRGQARVNVADPDHEVS